MNIESFGLGAHNLHSRGINLVSFIPSSVYLGLDTIQHVHEVHIIHNCLPFDSRVASPVLTFTLIHSQLLIQLVTFVDFLNIFILSLGFGFPILEVDCSLKGLQPITAFLMFCNQLLDALHRLFVDFGPFDLVRRHRTEGHEFILALFLLLKLAIGSLFIDSIHSLVRADQ